MEDNLKLLQNSMMNSSSKSMPKQTNSETLIKQIQKMFQCHFEANKPSMSSKWDQRNFVLKHRAKNIQMQNSSIHIFRTVLNKFASNLIELRCLKNSRTSTKKSKQGDAVTEVHYYLEIEPLLKYTSIYHWLNLSGSAAERQKVKFVKPSGELWRKNMCSNTLYRMTGIAKRNK